MSSTSYFFRKRGKEILFLARFLLFDSLNQYLNRPFGRLAHCIYKVISLHLQHELIDMKRPKMKHLVLEISISNCKCEIHMQKKNN